MAIRYDKLVRDRIPEIVAKDGKVAATHVATDEEYAAKLREKLQEEVAEYLASGAADELADIAEVLRALAAAQGVDQATLDALRDRKAEERGGFSKRIILDEVV